MTHLQKLEIYLASHKPQVTEILTQFQPAHTPSSSLMCWIQFCENSRVFASSYINLVFIKIIFTKKVTTTNSICFLIFKKMMFSKYSILSIAFLLFYFSLDLLLNI